MKKSVLSLLRWSPISQHFAAFLFFIFEIRKVLYHSLPGTTSSSSSSGDDDSDNKKFESTAQAWSEVAGKCGKGELLRAGEVLPFVVEGILLERSSEETQGSQLLNMFSWTS